jgi:hypothetical protein
VAAEVVKALENNVSTIAAIRPIKVGTDGTLIVKFTRFMKV